MGLQIAGHNNGLSGHYVKAIWVRSLVPFASLILGEKVSQITRVLDLFLCGILPFTVPFNLLESHESTCSRWSTFHPSVVFTPNTGNVIVFQSWSLCRQVLVSWNPCHLRILSTKGVNNFLIQYIFWSSDLFNVLFKNYTPIDHCSFILLHLTLLFTCCCASCVL